MTLCGDLNRQDCLSSLSWAAADVGTWWKTVLCVEDLRKTAEAGLWFFQGVYWEAVKPVCGSIIEEQSEFKYTTAHQSVSSLGTLHITNRHNFGPGSLVLLVLAAKGVQDILKPGRRNKKEAVHMGCTLDLLSWVWWPETLGPPYLHLQICLSTEICLQPRARAVCGGLLD